MIADNRLALDAGWDEEMLALELADLSEAEYDLALTGFEDAGREQREKNGEMRARNGHFRRAILKRSRPETGPTQRERAKKIPTDEGWDFEYMVELAGFEPASTSLLRPVLHA